MVWKVGQGDAYALLESLLAEAGEAGPLPPIARTAGGKPYFPTRAGLRFSVSHSGGVSLCALSGGEVGCDVELVRPRSRGLPGYALSAPEQAWFRERGGRWEDFYTLWTLKEARVKCTGRGLVPPVRDIAVPLIAPGETAALDGLTFTALAGEDWRGAVCENKNTPVHRGKCGL